MNISLVIEENLTHLFIFAFLMTSQEKNAKKLTQLLLAEVDSCYKELSDNHDLKSRLFRILYQFTLKYEGQNINDHNGDSDESLEEFFLYNRLEEDHMYDQDAKLNQIYNISVIELENIIANLPPSLRSYMLLRDIFDFSYRQISYILNVPQNEILTKLSLVRKLFQSELWNNILNMRQYVRS
jgi:DNA-directed RNA polymerase specialized sigma24 family protein